MRRITITLPCFLQDKIEQSRLETANRTGTIPSMSVYIRWLIRHGLEEADKLNKGRVKVEKKGR